MDGPVSFTLELIDLTASGFDPRVSFTDYPREGDVRAASERCRSNRQSLAAHLRGEWLFKMFQSDT